MRYYQFTETKAVARQGDLTVHDGKVPEGWVEISVHRKRTALSSFIARTLGGLIVATVLGFATFLAITSWNLVIGALS